MERKTCEVLGLQINYYETDCKTGTPLVILHGWGSQAERWRQVLAILEHKKIYAIALDLPGFGNSGAPQEPWGLENYEDFVLDFLKKINFNNFCLLGHSFGGRIATKLAARRITGLEKLFLVASAGVTPRNKARIATYKLATKLMRPILILPVLRGLEPICRKFIYKISGSYDYYLQKGAMKKTFKKVVEEDLAPYLTYINVPTHIIWGAQDNMTPLSDAKLLREKIKNSRLTVFENGNHSLNLQIPERLAAAIVKFL